MGRFGLRLRLWTKASATGIVAAIMIENVSMLRFNSGRCMEGCAVVDVGTGVGEVRVGIGVSVGVGVVVELTEGVGVGVTT